MSDNAYFWPFLPIKKHKWRTIDDKHFVILQDKEAYYIKSALHCIKSADRTMLQSINNMNFKMLIAAAIGLLLLSACSNNNESTADDQTVHSVLVTTPVGVGDYVQKQYSGVVAENKSISLGFKVAGQIARTCVKEGDYVKQGQLIATLDDVDYRLALKDAEVQYKQQASEQQRLDYLHSTNNLSDNDFEKSSAGLERLRVNLENCRNRVNYTRLYAPVSGYVVKLNFEKSEMVNAGTPVVELMDNSSFEVHIDLPQEAYIKRNSFRSFSATTPDGATIPLTLISITPKADNNQLFTMRLSLPKSAAKLTSGMNVAVTINRDNDKPESSDSAVTQGYFKVPLRAVFYDAKKNPAVWVVKPDSTVTAQPVTLGDLTDGKMIAVTAGLNGGETIVRAGVNSLQQGEKVAIIDEGSDSNVGRLL
jgi:RND family efflux transporter MFP subunit